VLISKIIKRSSRVIGIIIAGVILIFIANSIYQYMRTRIPHRISSSADYGNEFIVEGKYYYIDSDGVLGLKVKRNYILINSYSLINYGLGSKFETKTKIIVRKLTKEDVSTRKSSDWKFLKSAYGEKTSIHTFLKTATNEIIMVYLPQGNGEFLYEIYDLANDKWLFVMASGNWKVGPESYYAYTTVQRISSRKKNI
jgi:hypothetical protein